MPDMIEDYSDAPFRLDRQEAHRRLDALLDAMQQERAATAEAYAAAQMRTDVAYAAFHDCIGLAELYRRMGRENPFWLQTILGLSDIETTNRESHSMMRETTMSVDAKRANRGR